MAEPAYVYTIDPYPQQYEDVTRVHPFYTALREDGKLITTRCKRCGAVHWPPRVVCRECLSDDVEWIDLPKRGQIAAFSISEAGIDPRFKPPVVYAIIDFAETGVRIISPLVETDAAEVTVGAEVELKVVDVPPDQDGRRRVMFYFKLVK